VWKVEIDLALLKLESARNILCSGIKKNHEFIIGEHLFSLYPYRAIEIKRGARMRI